METQIPQKPSDSLTDEIPHGPTDVANRGVSYRAESGRVRGVGYMTGWVVGEVLSLEAYRV